MIKDLSLAKETYVNDIYGQWRTGEKVSYEVLEKTKRVVVKDPANPFLTMFKLATDDEGKDVEIFVDSVKFTVRAYLPQNANKGKTPVIICMHPIMPKDFALENGYALIFLDTSEIAEDNCFRKGCFYELYPYTEDPKTQTGELMAWGWGISKVIDALYEGLDEKLNIDKNRIIVTGVSRWGKATAVLGAFDERIKVTMPTCSGAGGLALWNVLSEGKTYDLTEYGGPKEYTYEKNEPLSCLQSDAEKGWFVDKFLSFAEYKDIPVEQYMLPCLAVNPDRYYLIVAAVTKEDWVNAPAMKACYEEAKEMLKSRGLEDHLQAHFHLEGHAVLEEDLKVLFELMEQIQ